VQQNEGEAAHFGGEDGGQTSTQAAVLRGGIEVFGGFEEVKGGFAGLFAPEPVEMAGRFPVGDVLFRYGVAVEFIGDKIFDVGEAVEPLDDFDTGLVVFNAEAELMAD
jgi:hypothetical protein